MPLTLLLIAARTGLGPPSWEALTSTSRFGEAGWRRKVMMLTGAAVVSLCFWTIDEQRIFAVS
jgi:hypothetical protein